MKVRITGFDKNCDMPSYDFKELKDHIGDVHVIDLGCGDGERTICSLDMVHGIQAVETVEAVTCRDCIKSVKYAKSIKLGKG